MLPGGGRAKGEAQAQAQSLRLGAAGIHCALHAGLKGAEVGHTLLTIGAQYKSEALALLDEQQIQVQLGIFQRRKSLPAKILAPKLAQSDGVHHEIRAKLCPLFSSP